MAMEAPTEPADAPPLPPLPPPQAPPIAEINSVNTTVSGLDGREVSAVEAANSADTAPQQTPPDPATELTNSKPKSAEHVVEILHELTTSVGINAELQCTLCHEPVTTPCGHSFCRVCLVEYLLSKELEETQCPICRGLVLHASVDGSDGAPTFCVNVTLWNLIQFLVPALRDTGAADEDAEYALKYDQFDAKWRIAALQQSAGNHHRRLRRLGMNDEIDSSGDEMVEGHDDGSDHDEGLNAPGQVRREQYPELRQENTVDGHLEVFRNVVLDRDDANEDGYEGMRVSLAVMEFPSLFQPFNENQECSIVVLKCEEDEDMDAGIPFFTSGDSDDDALIISDYYNEIRLRVTDNAGNIVMERTRGSTQGIATFPNLRLDVPAGMYDFQFKDDLYGVRLTIRTEVRDLRDEDVSSEIGNGRLVLDQAGERTRSRRRRQDSEADDDEEEGSGSDESFIVNDDEDLEHDQAGAASFSGDDNSEAAWSNHDEDDEEAIMEAYERDLQRERRGINPETYSSQDYQESDDDIGGEGSPAADGDSDPDDEDDLPSSVSSGRAGNRNRIVDDDSESDGLNDAHPVPDSASWNPPAAIDNIGFGQQAGRKRSRAVMESEDESASDGNEESKSQSGDNGFPNATSAEPVRGFSSNKRLRQLSSRMFQDEDDEDEYNDQYDESEQLGEEDADGVQHHRSRWIGSDPFWTRRRATGMDAAAEDDAEDADEATHDCIGPACHECFDPVEDAVRENTRQASDQSQSEDEEERWNESNAVEYDGDEGDFSD